MLVPGGRIALAVWRSIEHNPAFAAFAGALDRHVDAEAAAMMRAPFSGPGREQLRRLLGGTSFAAVRILIASLLVRFPSAQAFLRQVVASSPWRARSPRWAQIAWPGTPASSTGCWRRSRTTTVSRCRCRHG